MGGDAGDTDAAAASGGGGISVNVRCSNGAKFSVRADLESTVGVFKEAVAASNPDVPAAQQRLIYKGRILKDDQTLASYGVEAEHTIHLVRGATSSVLNAPATGNPGIAKTANSTPPTGSLGALGSNAGGDLGDSAIGRFPGLAALGGTASPFGSGFPDLEQMQQQLTQNPNMMRDMMNTPVIQNLMNNPDLFRNLIMSNPQMREIIDRNPDLAHILNDPGTLRQTLEAARNPELMREMMRNTDRAMSNIESSPEGFNMLRRMYETVHEPLLNATTVSENGGGTLGSNPFAALLGNQGSAVGRDRSVNSSTANSESIGSPVPNTNPLPNPWGNAAGGGQPNNAMPPPLESVRLPGIAGLGGAGLPERTMPDASLFNQVLQNPATTQMMQTLLSNPQYVNQILGSNPEIRNLMESNAQLRQMLQNPEFLRQLASPETLRQIHELQQSILSIIPQSGLEQNQTNNIASGTPNAGLDMLMNMFSGFGTGALGSPNTSNVPPEELYATQLSQLQEMGFFDTQENIRALSATAGNVHAAVERLLGNLGQ